MSFRKPFRAAPLRGKRSKIIPFRRPKSRGPTLKFWDEPKAKPGNWWAIAIAVISVLLIGTGLLMRYGVALPFIDDPQVIARHDETPPTKFTPHPAYDPKRPPSASRREHHARQSLGGRPAETHTAFFSICDGPAHGDCVVDGDTFWLGGEKYRVLDINTPEISHPRCDRELALGQAATKRLRELLNAGPFSLESGPEETDRYGRKLRRITRGGQSLGDILVAEGLAERWQGFRRNWC